MSTVVLPKKYTDVEIKEGKWECPDCCAYISIRRHDGNLRSRIKEHLQSKKHQLVVASKSIPSERDLLKQ